MKIFIALFVLLISFQQSAIAKPKPQPTQVVEFYTDTDAVQAEVQLMVDKGYRIVSIQTAYSVESFPGQSDRLRAALLITVLYEKVKK